MYEFHIDNTKRDSYVYSIIRITLTNLISMMNTTKTK